MNDLLRLLRMFKPYWGWTVLGIFLSFITLLANVGLMAVSGWFISAMAMAGAAGVTMNYFTPSALIRLAAIVRTAGRYGERLVTHEATFRLLAELRVWFYQQLEPLAPARLEAYRSGDLLSRIRADIDKLDTVYLRLLVPLVVAMLATLVFVVVLLFYHPLLALVEGTLLLVAGVFIPWLMNRLGHTTGQQIVATKAQMRAALVNDLQGMGELLVYGAAASHASEINRLSHELARQQQAMSGLQGVAQGALGLCANLAMWGMLLVAIPLVSDGRLAPPELAMLALFALASFEAVMPLPLAFQTLGETLAALRRIFELTDMQPAVLEPQQPLPMPHTFHFAFKDVVFRYGENADTLHNITLDFSPASKLAVVGATGSGKSTLASLLLRFRESASGEILLAGQPIQHYSGEALRQHIAVVPQQTHLFNATIRDNLLLAKPDADQAAIEAACRLALIHDFISSQPQGYDTWVGETGVRLSGGQAKRVAIARALLKNVPVLILDEPTEGLDPETARQVMHNIVGHVQINQQSLLLITHRLQGLEQMDNIHVMDAGHIIESGTHAGLLAAQGHYHYLTSINKLLVEQTKS
ncbi:MAG: thiol reductant ABC exporter subunit CydC [Gammaproteobacteria bacterium]|nr:thiol reductant ABC exporter subunit CydC [Gammaproteobacteria bacterium]MBU1724071.1 thiol reductant ABC exporter subunit CydC [Gammaproteobacteria bacterium]MBU2006860.1 thiol reductant ABC exporter subunit CydC [Gammaproteobacteria bacterium]